MRLWGRTSDAVWPRCAMQFLGLTLAAVLLMGHPIVWAEKHAGAIEGGRSNE